MRFRGTVPIFQDIPLSGEKFHQPLTPNFSHCLGALGVLVARRPGNVSMDGIGKNIHGERTFSVYGDIERYIYIRTYTYVHLYTLYTCIISIHVYML